MEINGMNVRGCGMAFAIAVLSSGSVAAQQRAVAPRLTPIATFGCEDCSGPTQFSRIQAVSIVDATHVLVADESDPRLRVFTVQGAPVKSFGRTGEGPGEVGSVTAVAGDVGGGALVFDLGLGRISFIRDDGRARMTVPAGGFITTAVIAPEGRRAVFATTRGRDSELALQNFVDGKASAALRVTPAMFPGRTQQLATVPVAVSDDGTIAVGDGSAAYRIEVFAPNGDRKASITRAVARIKKTRAEVLAEAGGTERMMAAVAASAVANSGGKAKPKVPKVDPATVDEFRDYFETDALHYDSAGNLWVHVSRGPAATSVFDVFNAARTYLGEVTVKGNVRYFDVSHGLLAAVVVDAETEVERISVWRVDK
jgi:hypothetical protein